MLAPSGAAKATNFVVSFREENNTQVEIPRYNREDKPKLWASKLEIHHNMMMEKIRVMVQQKLVEEVSSNDDFFANMDALAIDNDDDDDDDDDDDNSWRQEQNQKQQKPETEEDILLAKKARILQNLLNEIMELPKDDILSFLTSSSLPAGLSNSSAKTNPQQGQTDLQRAQKESETIANNVGDDSDLDSSENTNDRTKEDGMRTIEGGDTDGLVDGRDGNGNIDNNQNQETYRQQDDQDENYGYNWIMDCNDAWKDLPPVVRVNAIELGYTETFWDEDYQDLPIFRTIWKDLTPNQRMAAVFLGNYDEETWDEDAKMLLMTAEDPPWALIPEDVHSNEEPIAETPSFEKNGDETTSASENYSKSTSDSTIATTTTESSGDQDDNDDDAMFNDFLSNFAAEINDSEERPVKRNGIPKQKSDDQEVVAKKARVDADDSKKEEEDMMDEFLSNFGASTEDRGNLDPKNEEEEEATTDKSLSEGDDLVTSDNEKNVKKGGVTNSSKLDRNNNDDDVEEAIMDEFLSNFVATKEDKKTDSDIKKKKDEDKDEGEDEEEAVMDEFLSNFTVTKKDDKADSYNEKKVEKESTVDADEMDPKNEDEEETMMDEFLSNFVATTDDDSIDDENEEKVEKVGKESTVNTSNLVPKNEDEEKAIMDEFLSNFVVSKEDQNEENPEKESLTPTTSVLSSDTKDETTMMDEFVSNFVLPAKEDDKIDSDNVESSEEVIIRATTSVLTNNDNEDDNNETAMMDEFVSNFVVSTEEDDEKESDEQIPKKESLLATAGVLSHDDEDENEDTAVMNDFVSNVSEAEEQEQENSIHSTNESAPQHYGSVPTSGLTATVDEFKANDADEDHSNSGENKQTPSNASLDNNEENNVPQHQRLVVDTEETPLVSKPREISMERGFEDEESPLIPSKEKNERQIADPPVSAWETYSPYLFWVPVMIVAPLVYWNRR